MKKLLLGLTLALPLFASTGDELVQNNGCMSCHNIMGKKSAPAFMGVARKNLKWFGSDAKSHIKESIKNGSKGKYRHFLGSEMPAFSYLSDSDRETLANWILQKYEENKGMMKNHKCKD
jgi:cytochrome c